MQDYKYTYLLMESNLLCQEVTLQEGFVSDNVHVHHNDEFLIVDTESVVEQASSGKFYTIQTPALIWNRTGSFHQITRVLKGDYHCWVISYHKSILTDLPENLVHNDFLQDCDLLSIPLNPQQLEELKRIMVPMRPPGTPQFQRLMYLLSLFDKIGPWAVECPQLLKSSNNPHYVFQLASKIQDLGWEMQSLEDLAQGFFVSKTKLKSDFKRIIGMPILAFRRQVQLQNACALLETTKMDMAQIAGECGFSDESYFIRVFRKQYGITPGTYRKKFRKQR